MAMPSGESLRQSSKAKSLAAGVLERLAAANAELFQRLDAIGGKARRGDGDALDALLRIGRERRVGRRLQPFGAAEPRLERDVDLAAERFADSSRAVFWQWQ